MTAKPAKLRARDLGLPFEGTPGKFNAITDVSGVEVGFTTINEGEGPLTVGKGPIRTGVTAILPRGKQSKPSPVWCGQFNFNGNGEMTGTHWINEAGYFISPICITNTHSVGITHHAVVGWMIDQYKSFFQDDHAWAMPVIAETYDGLTNDICGRHIKEKHVLAALNSAQSGPVQEGNVGGGTGMITYEFKGGTGTSSRIVKIGFEEYNVGVLVQSNFGSRKDLKILGAPGQLFRTPAAAGCTISDAEAEFETSDDHAGFHVHWSMTCANPGKMTMLEILYFDAFAAAEEIEVEAIGKAGQSAIEVEKDMRQVDLTGAFGD